MDRFKKLFKHFDYFGVDITFHYQGKERYKTVFGGCLFIFFIIVCFAYFILFFIYIPYKYNYSLFVFNEYLNSVENISLNNYKYNFSLSLFCDNNQNDLMTYLDIKLIDNRIEKMENNDNKLTQNYININKYDY